MMVYSNHIICIEQQSFPLNHDILHLSFSIFVLYDHVNTDFLFFILPFSVSLATLMFAFIASVCSVLLDEITRWKKTAYTSMITVQP